MSDLDRKAAIEGLLFVAGEEGLDAQQLAEVLEVDKAQVIVLVQQLARDYEEGGRGLQIVEVAEAYQLTTRPELAPYFRRLAHTPSHSTLSQAALETLSIIAYKQPLTRIEVEEIRGVRSEKAIHTLVAKGLIQEVGRQDVVGRPILYGTTKEFLEYFGLNSLKELPEMPALLNPEDVEEEARLLFDKLGAQMSFEDLEKIGD